MLDFPNSPSVGQLFPSSNPLWRWDGSEWAPYALYVPSGLSAKQRVFTTVGSQTYTPTPGTVFVIVECVGGGGGGGGNGGAASQSSGSGGGGGGSYSRSLLTIQQIGASQTIFVGGAGAGGGAGLNAGLPGGGTSFGSFVTTNGGSGGGAGSGGASPVPGLGGAAGTGDIAIKGGDGGTGMYLPSATATAFGGYGGSSMYAPIKQPPAGAASSNTAGVPGNAWGGGGVGAAAMGVGTTGAGGGGASGICIVTEFGLFAPSPSAFVAWGHLSGLTLSTAGASATFSVAAGQAADSNNGDMLALGAAISKTTGAWAIGTGNGALDTGAIAANTWYHVFVIKRADTGVVDVLVSLSPSAPSLPASYTLFRRIGAMRTNASSQWTKFMQRGDEFLWDVPVSDVNNVGTNNGVQTITVTVPTGIQVNALFAARADYGSASCAIWFSAFDVANVTTGGPLAMLITGVSTGNCAGMFNMRTSTLGQFRFNGNSPNSFYSIATFGWIDRRGRDT